MLQMRAAIWIPFALLVWAGTVRGGELLDDYLNYVRPGPGTGPGDVPVAVRGSRPIGQSLTVAAGTGEIYRIGVRPVYETWATGETVTLTLYDSPARRSKLGSYSVAEETCRVSEIHETKDRVLFFQLRVPTKGRKDVYFELSVSGGDGAVSFQAFRKEAYAGGQCVGAASDIRDLAFLCHVKPAADREANLQAFFTERLKVDLPALRTVKAAVQARDWETAIAEAVKHFHAKMDVWGEWKDFMAAAPKADADTAVADLVLKGMLRHVETKQPLPWRCESYWTPEYRTERAQASLAAEPSPFLWHIDRELGTAYANTGRKEYVRKAIDLRMQFILDNPSPKKSGLPWYFELWNDRTAGGRAPGHGSLVYARFYSYGGWTNDEKLVFFSFLEDNAAWDYKAESGANWGAEAARACYEFGLNFPEWKMSPEYVRWGTGRLAQIVTESVRGDGTSTEAAIKYHAMVARRLRGMLEDHIEGRVQLDAATLASVERIVERMYEVMAYTLQPHGYVVMCGDSWYENYTDELAKSGELVNRPDFVWIATQGKKGKPPREISKVFPGGGYFIMRSDFGGSNLAYADARQMFIHNGGWFGSHGHYDLTSLNLYAYGRPLIIDPGQYDHTPPAGIDNYWTSKIHSMLVADGRDVKREEGPSEWASNDVMDWYDGRHYGYRSLKDVQDVRRRVVFLKPDYFIVDDSARTTAARAWAQVWNLADPNATIDAGKGVIATAFKDGGNVAILNQNPSRFTVEAAKGITSTKEQFPETKIFRVGYRTNNPRYQTLVYPYRGAVMPNVTWRMILAEGARGSDLSYAVEISAASAHDWLAFGEAGKPLTFRQGPERVDADCAVVRLGAAREPLAFAWTRGRHLSFGGKILAKADAPVHSLGVQYDGQRLVVQAPEPESSLAIQAGEAKTCLVNGQAVKSPLMKDGMFLPFGDQPRAIVADDLDRFERVTKTDEWTRLTDPRSWAGGYTVHETDPGRNEAGYYVFDVPAAGRYAVAVNLPAVSQPASDRVEFTVAAGGSPAKVGGSIVDVRSAQNTHVLTVNQQTGAGWVALGEFSLNKGRWRVLSRNVTTADSLYFVADAMRLMPVSR